MWAQQLVAPNRFEFREVTAPRESSLAVGDVIVRLEAGGICGSDLPFFKGAAPNVPGFSTRLGDTPPGLPLHEIVGTVVAERGTDLRVGDRVVGWATSVAGLAELVTTSASSLISIDSDLPPGRAVALQPLACVLHALDRVSDIEGRSATILGVGPIGVLFAHVLRSRGAQRVLGVDAVDRSDLALSFGMDEFVQSTASSYAATCRADSEVRADLVVEAIGHQSGTLFDVVDVVADGGTILYFGIVDDEYLTIPFGELARRNATLMAGFTEEPGRRAALAKAVNYVQEFPDLLPAYVTHEFQLAHAGQAFAMAASPVLGQLKIVVTYPPTLARSSEHGPKD